MPTTHNTRRVAHQETVTTTSHMSTSHGRVSHEASKRSSSRHQTSQKTSAASDGVSQIFYGGLSVISDAITGDSDGGFSADQFDDRQSINSNDFRDRQDSELRSAASRKASVNDGTNINEKPDSQPTEGPQAASTEPATIDADVKLPSLPDISPIDEKKGDEKGGFTVVEREVDRDLENGEEPLHSYQPTLLVRRIASIIRVLNWSIMILFPLFFLGLAIWAISVNTKPIRDLYGYRVDPNTYQDDDPLNQAIYVSASLWPIVFAAVVAQSLKAYAAFKVERGIQLMTLEQLISSHSVGGAIKQPFKLRNFNLTSLVLLGLWVLSPLSGQAILRMSITDYTSQSKPFDVFYFSPQDMPYAISELAYKPSGLSPLNSARINTMYNGLLLTSETSQYSPMDSWGNVKIPIWPPAYPQPDEPPNGTTRWNYAAGETLTPSSLLGIPINDPVWDAPTEIEEYTLVERYEVTVTTTSFILQCLDVEKRRITDIDMAALNFSSDAGRTLFMSAENSTALKDHGIDPPTPGDKGVIHLGSVGPLVGDDTESPFWYWKCPYHQIAVSNNVLCESTFEPDSAFSYKCNVTSQEKLDNYPNFQPLGYYFIKAMIESGGQGDGNSTNQNKTSTDTERYLEDPYFSGDRGPQATDPLVNLGLVPPQTFSLQLGQLVNTIWMAGTQHQLFFGAPLEDNSTSPHFNLPTTPATTYAQPYLIYKTVWGWAGVLVVSSSILLIFGICAPFLEHRTIGPDFLGFASTAVSDRVRMPKGISDLRAHDRLAALQNCDVQLQDVRPRAPVGKIALGVKVESSVPLKQNREYR